MRRVPKSPRFLSQEEEEEEEEGLFNAVNEEDPERGVRCSQEEEEGLLKGGVGETGAGRWL